MPTLHFGWDDDNDSNTNLQLNGIITISAREFNMPLKQNFFTEYN